MSISTGQIGEKILSVDYALRTSGSETIDELAARARAAGHHVLWTEPDRVVIGLDYPKEHQ